MAGPSGALGVRDCRVAPGDAYITPRPTPSALPASTRRCRRAPSTRRAGGSAARVVLRCRSRVVIAHTAPFGSLSADGRAERARPHQCSYGRIALPPIHLALSADLREGGMEPESSDIAAKLTSWAGPCDCAAARPFRACSGSYQRRLTNVFGLRCLCSSLVF